MKLLSELTPETKATPDGVRTLLRDTASSWAREHAPFCLWRVFLRDVEQWCQ